MKFVITTLDSDNHYVACVFWEGLLKRKPFIEGAAAETLHEAYESLLKATSQLLTDLMNDRRFDGLHQLQTATTLEGGGYYDTNPTYGLIPEQRIPTIEVRGPELFTAGVGGGVGRGPAQQRGASRPAPVSRTCLQPNGWLHQSPYNPYTHPFDPYFQQFDPRSRSQRPGN